MPDIMRTFSTGNFWLGLGTAVAISVLGPTIGRTAKPLAIKGVQGMFYLTDKTGEMLKAGKEQVTHMVESGMETMGDKMPSKEDMHHLVSELREQNMKATQEITRLYHEIGDLKNQVEQMKPM